MTGCGINHGAYGGYQKPRKLGVEECTECLAAQVWYARRRRESAEVREPEPTTYTCGDTITDQTDSRERDDHDR